MYHLRILTPEEPFFEGDILSLIIPGEEGYLGILKNHTPLMIRLREGIVTIKNQNDTVSIYKIDQGFFTVKNNQAVLLIETINSFPRKELEDFRS